MKNQKRRLEWILKYQNLLEILKNNLSITRSLVWKPHKSLKKSNFKSKKPFIKLKPIMHSRENQIVKVVTLEETGVIQLQNKMEWTKIQKRLNKLYSNLKKQQTWWICSVRFLKNNRKLLNSHLHLHHSLSNQFKIRMQETLTYCSAQEVQHQRMRSNQTNHP